MKDNIVKADYEMTFSLDEIVTMADDNVSYGGGRFAKKWLDEIENNSTDFVHFIAQAIDEYDKSVPVDIDKQVAITDDDMNTMYAWRESDWVFDGVLENYPKMTRDEEGKISYTVKGDSVIVKMSVGIDVDMLRYKLDIEYRERQKNERADRMAKAEQDNENTGYWKVTMEYYDDSPLNRNHDKRTRYNVYVSGYNKEEARQYAREYVCECEKNDDIICVEPISKEEWEIGSKAFGEGVRSTENLMQTFDKKDVDIEQNKTTQKGKEQ